MSTLDILNDIKRKTKADKVHIGLTEAKDTLEIIVTKGAYMHIEYIDSSEHIVDSVERVILKANDELGHI